MDNDPTMMEDGVVGNLAQDAMPQSPDAVVVEDSKPEPVVVSDDDEEVVGDGLDDDDDDDDKNDGSYSVVESDSEWDEDDNDNQKETEKSNGGALSASNLEEWLFSSGSPEEEVVSDEDVPDVSMEVQDGGPDSRAAMAVQENDEVPEPSFHESEEQEEVVVGDALSLIKKIDEQKVAKQQQETNHQPKSPSEKDFFEPSADQVAKRKLEETRTSKELELEALRNRGLAGRKSRQLKKTINKNIKSQMMEQRNDMEFRKIGKGGGDDCIEDNIEIGTMTTTTTIAVTSKLLPSPTQKATSPTSSSMAYEQLAMEQQKERQRAREMEKETMIQNQLHPESQIKKDVKLLEMDFVFGLLVGEKDPAPDMRMAKKAASKIVPNMLTSKKTIYYDPRYPPKVTAVELDESYSGKNEEDEQENKPIQKRYMVKGKVPVLPRKRSSKRKSSLIPPSPTTSATVSTQPLTPLTLTTGSASNSVCSNGASSATSTNLKKSEELALPSMEAAPSGDCDNEERTEQQEETAPESQQLAEEPTSSNDDEMEGVLEGPLNTSTEEFMSPVAASNKPKLVVDTRSSSTDIQSIRTSKDAELEAIRQRGVAKQKNLGFTKLEVQSAMSKAAYEAEQQDLERRKSGRSEFQFAAGKIVNPLDQLYLQQNKQNRSYREIQQKTLEEYHRASSSVGAGDGSISNKEEDDAVPSDEEVTKPSSKMSDPVPNEPPVLSAKDQASRQSRYDKLFQKIRPKSKQSLNDEIDPIWQENASNKKAVEPEMSKQDRQRRYDAMFQKESFDPELDVKSSELKFEQLRKAKQDELKALRERGLQHKTSDGKIRIASEVNNNHVPVAAATQVQSTTLTTPPRGGAGADGLVGFGMLLKKSPPKPSGELNLNPPGFVKPNPPTGQEWRAIDDASPSRLKHVTLRNSRAEEVARLRQQGLAKQGSQKYAVFEQTVRESQKEYEAAAQDLARRKSQTSEYVFTGTKEIGPVDALYLEHQQWRKDIVKEEKEALGLFDEKPEHVDQEDVEGRIPVSNAKFTNTKGYQKWESGDRAVGDVGGKKKKKKFGVESNCGCTIM